MMKRITNPTELALARSLRSLITEGPEGLLSRRWIEESCARVIAQESGRHLEPEEAVAAAASYADAGITELIAIVNDSLIVEEEIYRLEASVDDLNDVSDELSGINLVLTDLAGTRCILFTTSDFKLVAGPLEFVTAIAGDPVAAREEFLAFAHDLPEFLLRYLRGAVPYMNWIENDRRGGA